MTLVRRRRGRSPPSRSGDDRRVLPRRRRARPAPARGHRGRPGARRAASSSSSGPPTRWPAPASVTPAQLAGHRIWMPGIVRRHRVGRLLRRPRRRVRAHHRRDRPRLRHRARCWTRSPTPRPWPPSSASRPGLVWPDGYDLRRIPVTRPDAGLPALADLARRQPAPGAGHAPRPPRRHERPATTPPGPGRRAG